MKSKTRLGFTVLLCTVLVLAVTACAGCTDTSIRDVNDTAVEPDIPVVSVPQTPDVTAASAPVKSGKEIQPSVTQGGYVTVTLKAPYGSYRVSVSPSGIIPHGQPNVDTQTPPYTQNYALVHVGTSGQQSFTVQSVSSEDITVRLED